MFALNHFHAVILTPHIQKVVQMFQVQIMCTHQAHLAHMSFEHPPRLQRQHTSNSYKTRSHLVCPINQLSPCFQVEFHHKANIFKKHGQRSHARSRKHKMHFNDILFVWMRKLVLGGMSAPPNSIVTNSVGVLCCASITVPPNETSASDSSSL